MTSFLTTLRGTIHTGTLGEIFSHSLAIESSNAVDVVAASVKSCWEVAWKHATTGLQSLYSPQITYTEATAAEILGLSDGKLKAAFHSPWAPALPGTMTGNTLPSQVALAVSLTGGNRPNGTPVKGRFYLPPPVVTVTDPDGRATSTFQTRARDCVNDFFNALQASGQEPCVWSRTIPELTPVLNLRVGKTFDTIRRRRNHFAETYVATPQA